MIVYPVLIPPETARCAAEFHEVRRANEFRYELAAAINERIRNSVFDYQTLAYDDLASEVGASVDYIAEMLAPLGGGGDCVTLARR